MLKFNRNYILEIECGDGSLLRIGPHSDITIQFSVHFELLSTANHGSIRIYNLAEQTRNKIYHDAFDIGSDSVKFVKLQAGYGDKLYTILYGNIAEASSFREEGSVDFVTEIHTHDWSPPYTNATINKTLDGPISQQDVIKHLIGNLGQSSSPGVVKGCVSTLFNHQYTRARVLSGMTWDKLKDETNNQCFIINGVVHCLLDNDYILTPDPYFTVSSDTGLLTTPKKSGKILSWEMLFEPSLIPGQAIRLNSTSEGMYNTQPFKSTGASFYKIYKLSHTGIISSAVSGKCKTHVSVASSYKWNAAVPGTFTANPAALGDS